MQLKTTIVNILFSVYYWDLKSKAIHLIESVLYKIINWIQI